MEVMRYVVKAQEHLLEVMIQGGSLQRPKFCQRLRVTGVVTSDQLSKSEHSGGGAKVIQRENATPV